MTRIGDIGTPAIVNFNSDLAFYVSLALLRVVAKDVNIKYLYYYIQSQHFKRELYKRTIHNAFPIKINKNEIGKCIVILKNIYEQTYISDLLSLVDKKLSLAISKIEALKKYRKGIINSWFKNNEKTLRLCELVRQQTSQLLTHQIKDNIGTYPVYDATGRIYKSIDFYMNENDSIAIIKYGSGCGRTFITRDKHCVLGTMSELIPLNHDDLTYVFAFTESTKFKKICKKYIEVGTTPNLYYSDYSTELVYYPEERDNFVKLIDLINKKCVCLETEKENLGLLKRQLLKDMFI